MSSLCSGGPGSSGLEGAPHDENEGFQKFTYGQRKGLGAYGTAHYVVKIIPKENRIVIGKESDLYRKRISIKYLKDYNFVINEKERLKAKIRYKHIPADCVITELKFSDNICNIEFDEPQRAPTPGQSVVFYRENAVVGGGEIIETRN